MDNVLFNDTLDRKVGETEEKFRSIFEQSLASFLERQVPVSTRGPEAFEFKDMKSTLPGEVVLAALTATEGGPGRTLFVLSKESAGIIADLLLMGDGKATFSYEEHLEPMRDLFKEVMAAFCSELSLEIGHRVAFEEVKVTLVDLTPADFVGTGWISNRMEIGLAPQHVMYRIVSGEFFETCFPESNVHTETPEISIPTGDDGSFAEAQKEMGLVLDIELPISIELGRTAMLIRDIVKLAPGSIVELDKLSGEPVDLLVNGKMFARGEVVVVDENFAIRITELVTPAEYSRGRSN